LKREDSKIDEQICLYGRMSNSGLVFRDEQKQYQEKFQQVTKSAVSIEDDDSNLEELTTCTTYQSPLQATMILDIIPACVLILINRLSTISIKQIASIASKVRKSDSTSVWQYKSSLNIDTIRNVQDQQGLSLVFLDFVDYF
jgi:hypothetical protein